MSAEHRQTKASRPARERVVAVAVGLSVLLHALLLVALIVVPSGSASAKIELDQKPVKARLLRLGTKRDPKLLPRKPSAAPPPPPKVVEIAGAKPAPKPATTTPARTAASTAKQETKPDPKRRSALFNAFASAAASSDELSGDPEGDPDGDSDTADEGERYFGLILAKARRNYGITKTISPHELVSLKVVVVLYIGERGELLRDPQIQKSSGNDQFDQDVILSLRKAAPFGPPPQHLVQTLKTVG
ncbi:MAG: TonB C-terminal domain-containing protein, partial [Myxococcales bacterium]